MPSLDSPGICMRKAALVVATEIWPTPPASLFSEPPKKFATPLPKMDSARPDTFWFARRVMVRKLYTRPPSMDAATPHTSAMSTQTIMLGFSTAFS